MIDGGEGAEPAHQVVHLNRGAISAGGAGGLLGRRRRGAGQTIDEAVLKTRRGWGERGAAQRAGSGGAAPGRSTRRSASPSTATSSTAGSAAAIRPARRRWAAGTARENTRSCIADRKSRGRRLAKHARPRAATRRGRSVRPRRGRRWPTPPPCPPRALPQHRRHDAPQLAPRNRVHADRRFIQQQHARSRQQGAGQSQFLLHAAGKLACQPRGEGRQPGEIQQHLAALVTRLGGARADQRTARGFPRRSDPHTGQSAAACSRCLGALIRLMRHVVPQHAHPAGGGAQQPGEQAQQRGFARAIGAHQPGDHPRLDARGNAVSATVATPRAPANTWRSPATSARAWSLLIDEAIML